MRTTFIMSIALLSFMACSKEERVERRIDGDWAVLKLHYQSTSTGICDSILGDFTHTEIFPNEGVHGGSIEFSSEQGDMHEGSFFIMRPYMHKSNPSYFDWVFDFTYSISESEGTSIISMDGKFGDERNLEFEVIKQSLNRLTLKHVERGNCNDSEILLWCKKN